MEKGNVIDCPTSMQLNDHKAHGTALSILLLDYQPKTKAPYITINSLDGSQEVEGHYFLFPEAWEEKREGVWHCPIEQESFKKAFELAEKLTRRKYPDRKDDELDLGLDRDMYYLAYCDHMQQLTSWSWTEFPPEGWDELHDLASLLMLSAGIG